MGKLARFGTDRSGSVGVIFGLAVLPLVGLAGAAVDYSRAAAEHSKLQRAVDAAALALVREPRTASLGDLKRTATRVMDRVHASKHGAVMEDVVVDRAGDVITVSRRGRVSHAFLGVVGLTASVIGAEAKARSSNERLELALVLDNTGSMNEVIGSKRRIDELKRAAGALIDDLHKTALSPDDVRVSVVPFDTEVRVDPAKHRYGDWIRWNDRSDPKERAAFTGYLVDRYQPYDVRDDAPAMALKDTLYPKPKVNQYGGADLAFVQPLVSLHEETTYKAVKATIAGMAPRGNTNVGLGVSWGVATLTGSVPLGGDVSKDSRPVRRVMVVLTDGDNTQKWVDGDALKTSGPTDPRTKIIDDRTRLACDMAKGPKGGATEVFTIKLIKGSDALLKACASPPNARSPQHYFDVQSGAELAAAFKEIFRGLHDTRLTH